MIAVLIVDIWKTTPFMALLILAGLQMVPNDIYEAAKIDGVHPVKVFWKVTLPLVRPALMVAVIFRALDALRIFDLIYVLTPNNVQTKSMSVFAKENLFDFDKFALRLGRLDAALRHPRDLHRPLSVARPGQPVGRQVMAMKLVKNGAFYLLVLVIIVVAVFPFYYAILTSFKTGTALFQIDYWPKSFSLDNYVNVLTKGTFPRNLLNSLFVSSVVVALSLLLGITAAYALARVRFRGRSVILFTILSVSMFPQLAVLAGLFELVRTFGLINTPFALIFSYMIFTLPFTVWVLTTFIRDLPIEIEEAAIVDGATPWMIITRVFMPLMWPALVTTGLLAFIGAWNEFLFALTFTLQQRPSARCRSRSRSSPAAPVRDPVGQHHGGLGDRHRAAGRPGPHLPAQDHLRPDRRRRQRDDGVNLHVPEPAAPRARAAAPTGGAARSSTRSIRARFRTRTATASAILPASRGGSPTSPISASTRSGSRPSSSRR